MTQDAYRALARRLDEIPNGFPATEGGVELRLLARLFTPQEAALAVHLRLAPDSAAEIAARTGSDAGEVYSLLRGMAKRGLIRLERRPGELRFALLPFIVGFYELQQGRMDAELAALLEEYLRQAAPAILGQQPAVHRVIPVEQAVPIGIEILPYERASALLDQAAAWGVVDCICREHQRLLGRGCDHPLDVCLVMSQVAGAFDHAPGIRALTRQGADEVLRRAEEAGLVHSTSNQRGGIWYICNCCACCCGILRGVVELGLPQAVAHSGFWAVVDEGRCGGCEVCLERCRFGALSLDGGTAHVDHRRCAGCGLCTTVCPSEALSLQPRPAEEALPVPEDMAAWWAERARKRGLDLGRVL